MSKIIAIKFYLLGEVVNVINNRIENKSVTSSVKALNSLHLVLNAVVLMHVTMVLLDKAFLAYIALKAPQLQVAPNMVFHIAELLRAMAALETEEPLVFAASLWIDDSALLVLELQLGLSELFYLFHVIFLVKIC